MAPTITIHVDNSTYLIPMLSIGAIISKNSKFDVVIILGRQFDHSSKTRKIIDNTTLQVQYLKNIDIISFYPFSKFREVYELFNHIVNFLQIKFSLNTMFRRKKVVLTIFPADNRFDYSYYSKIYSSSEIPLIIVPNWFAGKSEILGTKHNSSVNVQSNLRLFFLRRFRRDYLEFINDNEESRVISCKTFSESFADLILGTTPPNPWILHSGYSDFILIDSESMRDQALELGFNNNKLIVTGSITHDTIYKEINRFKNSNTSKSIRILFALPPDFFTSRGKFCLDYSNQTQMIELVLTALRSKTKSSVTISLHPSTNFDEIFKSQLENKFNVFFSNQPIEILLANSTHFLASVSSTIRWALSLGIPVLNFDFYKFDYIDYQKAKNYIRVNSHEEFLNALDSFLQMGGEKSLDEKRYWGNIDGNAEQRILNSIFKVCRSI